MVDQSQPKTAGLGDKAFMLVARSGHICGATPCARVWLREHFRTNPESPRLPLHLRQWLLRSQGKRGQCFPFVYDDGDTQLVITLLHAEADGCFCLLLEKNAGGSPGRRARSIGLTARQLQVLRGVASGKSNKQIAIDLNVETATIKTHLEQIYAKLGVANRAAAISHVKSLL